MASFTRSQTRLVGELQQAIRNRNILDINRLVEEMAIVSITPNIFIKLVDIDALDAMVTIVNRDGFKLGEFYREFFELGKNEDNGEKRWKPLNELVFVSNSNLGGFPSMREITYEIFESWIKLDVVRLVRVIVPLFGFWDASKLKEYFVDGPDSRNGLIFTAAEVFDKNLNRIFGDLIDTLPDEIKKVALTTPKTNCEDCFNNENQFKGSLAIELLFKYTDAGNIVYEPHKFAQLPRIMRRVRDQMFHLLDHELEHGEKEVLQATINTVGRLIERLRYLGANSEVEEAQDLIYEVYSPFTQFFHSNKTKIIELFSRNQKMEWLFETTWDMEWIPCGMVPRYINIYDFRDDFPGKDLYMRTCEYTYITLHSQGEWRKRITDDSDDDDYDMTMLRDDENQFYWRARGFVFRGGQGWVPWGLADSSDEETESAASSEDSDDSDDFEPDRDAYGDDLNEEYWTERGFEWNEESDIWEEPEEFEVDRYSNEVNGNVNYWIDVGFDWNTIHGQWVSNDDFLLFYTRSRGNYIVVGEDDIVLGPGNEEYRVTSVTSTAIKIRPLGGEEFNALLDDITFQRISINYKCKKEIEPFDVVSVNGKNYFVLNIMRQQDQTYRIKLGNLDGSMAIDEPPSNKEITYIGNGKNYLWMSKSSTKEIHDFRHDYSGMAADKDGIVVAIDKDDQATEIQLYDKFEGERFPTIMTLDEKCVCIAMEGDLIAAGCGKYLYTFTRMGQNLQKKEFRYNISCLAISSDKLFVGDWEGFISTILRDGINETDGSYEYIVPTKKAHTTGVAVMDVDDDRLISSSGLFSLSTGSRLKIWDTEKAIVQDSVAGTPLKTLDDHSEFIRDLSIKGKYIVTGGDDKIVKKYKRDGTSVENIAVQFRKKLVVTDKYIVHDSLHNDGANEHPVYVLDIETNEQLTKTNAWNMRDLSMAVVGENIVMAWQEYSELIVYHIGGLYTTAKWEDGEMFVHQNGEYLPWTRDDNITKFLKKYDTVQLTNFEGKQIYAIGMQWKEGAGKDVTILGFDKSDVELMVDYKGVPYGDSFRIPFTEMEKRYDRNVIAAHPQANAPEIGETWVHRASGKAVIVDSLSIGSVYFKFEEGDSSEWLELDKFRYLFQIKPEIGTEWIGIQTRQRITIVGGQTLANEKPVPTAQQLFSWFLFWNVAPPQVPLMDRDGEVIEVGYMVELIGYRLPWKVMEADPEKQIRVKKLKPPKDPPEEDEILLVDANETVINYKPTASKDIIGGLGYSVEQFRYDDLPLNGRSLCMDIGTPQDCDVGEFTSTKYQPVAIMVRRGGRTEDEVDGDGRLTIFCAKELKDWLLTPEVETILEMGGYERQNFDPNTMRVLESDDLKETSPFTNSQIIKVRYLTSDEITVQVSKIPQEDNSKEIADLQARISRLESQVNRAEGRIKAFFEQQLRSAERSLMALQPTSSGSSGRLTGFRPRMLKF
jgi:WD40 repeat protein